MSALTACELVHLNQPYQTKVMGDHIMHTSGTSGVNRKNVAVEQEFQPPKNDKTFGGTGCGCVALAVTFHNEKIIGQHCLWCGVTGSIILSIYVRGLYR